MPIIHRVHAIYHDDAAGARELVEYLIRNGRRRIAYIGASKEGRSHTDRRQAWFDTLRKAGLTTSFEKDALEGTIEGGVAACNDLMLDADPLPNAIVCFNDVTAIGAMSVLRQANIAIPTQIAITGFDDIELAAVTDPPLTTVRQPLLDMGAGAMSLLIDLMDPETPVPAAPVLKYMAGELIVRGSA